ncbi:MAG: hypothetical protein V4804_11075 [Pseudomonadota bacterium]
MTELFISQLLDPFRIGLIVALVITATRTRGVTGTVLPLALGVGFIALMLPMTMAGAMGEPLVRLAGVGVVSNTVLLAIVLAARAVFLRLRS